jgi:hypothetical protein
MIHLALPCKPGPGAGVERLLLSEYEAYSEKGDIYALFSGKRCVYLPQYWTARTGHANGAGADPGGNPQWDGTHETLGGVVSSCGALSTQ